MKEVRFSEDPEVLKEALSLFLKEMDRLDSFSGTFQDGKIDGKFYSKGVFGRRRSNSLLAIQGNYDADKGELIFQFSRTLIFKIAFGIILLFMAIGAGKIFMETGMIIISLIPLAFGAIGLLIIESIYKASRFEFLVIFNNHLNLTKGKMEVV